MASETQILEALRNLSPNEQVAVAIVLQRHQAGECTFEEALEELREWREQQGRAA